MSALKLAPEAIKKLMKAFNKYDIDARHPETGKFYQPDDGDFPFYDPETYAQDIYNYVLEDFSTVNGYDASSASDMLEDVLGEAENLMQEGTIDDVIESIQNGKPDGWIQQIVENHAEGWAPEGSQELDEIINTIEETASDALTYYRDNWLGYHADNLLELGVNRVETPPQTGNLYKDLGKEGALSEESRQVLARMFDEAQPEPHFLQPPDDLDLANGELYSDPQEYAEQIYEFVADFGLGDVSSDVLNEVLNRAPAIMQSGRLDPILEGIHKGDYPDEIMDIYTEFADEEWVTRNGSDTLDQIEEALILYRDNYLGFNKDYIFPKNQTLGVLKSDGVAPAAPQGPTGVLSDPMGYPKVPGGMDAAQQVPPQEQAFEDLLRQLGLLHQY